MLNDEAFELWCARGKPTPTGVAYLRQVRSSEPARRTQGRAGNVHGFHASMKMRRTIQFESHKSELAACWELEFDRSVLEFWDQPPSVKLVYTARNGRKVGPMITPDYFVIREDRAGWEECKTEEQLLKLAETQPERWIKDEAGQWQSPPAAALAAEYGFYYRVRSSADINWVLLRNLQFMEDFLQSAPPVVPDACPILERVRRHPGISLAELLAGGFEPDEVYLRIAHGKLWIDYTEAPIVREPAAVHVFVDPEVAHAFRCLQRPGRKQDAGGARAIELAVGSNIEWDGLSWSVANVGQTAVTLMRGDSVNSLPHAVIEDLLRQGLIAGTSAGSNMEQRILLERLAAASVEDCAEANRRYELLLPLLMRSEGQHTATVDTLPRIRRGRGTLRVEHVPAERTLYRWLRAWRTAEKTLGHGYPGLLPARERPGNRRPKLPKATYTFVDEWIEKDFENYKQKGKFASYSVLKEKCAEAEILCPSYKTFVLMVRNRPQYKQLLSRKGSRAAYSAEAFYLELTQTTPRHGEWPFQIAHVDHTELDVELMSAHLRILLGLEIEISLGRPWLTLLIDAFSRRVLAVYVTFDPPSYRSAMMVLRECVHRHGRLPRTMVVDGGKEFQSVYFDRLLAHYRISKKVRPPTKSRFGGIVERLFGVCNTTFIHNLEGNTQITKNVRQVTKVNDPKNLALWTLATLHEALCLWAYGFYDTRPHPSLGTSPREAFNAGLAIAGRRMNTVIAYDEYFRIFTLPSTDKGIAKIRPNLGVKINNVYYWHNDFRTPELQETSVPVRFDPYDMSTAHAWVRGQWVRCVSEYVSVFAGRSQREIQIATAQLRTRAKNTRGKFYATARLLANFLISVEGRELLLQQQARDAEARPVLRQVTGLGAVATDSSSGRTPNDANAPFVSCGGETSATSAHPIDALPADHPDSASIEINALQPFQESW